MKCKVCKKEINFDNNWEDFRNEYFYILSQVDVLGEDSLTEKEQMLYNNMVHVKCVDLLP